MTSEDKAAQLTQVYVGRDVLVGTPQRLDEAYVDNGDVYLRSGNTVRRLAEGEVMVEVSRKVGQTADPYSKEALTESGRAIIAEADASIVESGVRPEDAYKEASKGE